MKTPTEFYKKLLAYDDKLNLDEAAPLTHKGVIHFITEYANQFCKPDVIKSVCDNCGNGKPSICDKCYETESNFRESY